MLVEGTVVLSFIRQQIIRFIICFQIVPDSFIQTAFTMDNLTNQIILRE